MRKKYIFSSKFTQKSRKPAYTNQHSVPFSTMVEKIIDESDIILEVLDARFIDKTRNLEVEKWIKDKGKKLMFILNKADLVDVKSLKFEHSLEDIKPYVLFSSKSRVGRARLKEALTIEAKKIKFDKVRVGVVGYPNTGKSSLINVLCGGRRTGTSPHAGFTKHIQKVKFKDNIFIYDSPGVITGGDENSIRVSEVKRQTEVGAKDYTKTKYPDLIINEIMKDSPEVFDKFYKVDSSGDAEILLEKLGKKWRYLKKKGEVDMERTARKILKDWQEGKIR